MDKSPKKNDKKSRVAILIALIVIFIMETVFLGLIVTDYLSKDEGDGILSFRVYKSEDNNGNVTDTEPLVPLFVGDSRTVGMDAAVEGIDCLAKVGTGYSYLKTLHERILNSGSDCIVIGFGVNDLKSIDDYTEFANKLGREVDKPVYFLTVNPVDEKRLYYEESHLSNKKIDEFNNYLKLRAKEYTVIDTNDYLKERGFKASDGLHYDDDTYKAIYGFVSEEIERLRHE